MRQNEQWREKERERWRKKEKKKANPVPLSMTTAGRPVASMLARPATKSIRVSE